jgi:microtubule-associated protein-like 5
LQHEAEILSLAVSNQAGDLIATGEIAESPKVHIWNSRTLDNYSILKGVHRRGIHLLAFTNNDEYLVTCGLTRPSAVIIYDWKNSLVLVSVSVSQTYLNNYSLGYERHPGSIYAFRSL